VVRAVRSIFRRESVCRQSDPDGSVMAGRGYGVEHVPVLRRGALRGCPRVLLSAQAVAPPPAAGRNLNIPYLAGVGAAAPRLCSPPPAAAAARISGLFPPLQRRACGLAPRSAHGESRGPVDPLVRRAYGRQEGLCLPALSRREPRSNAKVGMRVRH